MTMVAAMIGMNTMPVVSGGVLTSDSTYYYRYFSGNGTLSISNAPIKMDVTLIGGGGGGGGIAYVNFGGGGGGGGGGVFEISDQIFTPGSYIATIGSGGTAGTNTVTPTNGGATSFSIWSVNGGGRGGARTPSGFFNPGNGGASGGSGGGGSTFMNGGSGGSEPTFGLGFAGGNAGSSLSGGGGGGGAASAGTSVTSGNGQGGRGGNGYGPFNSWWTKSAAGGGGGSSYATGSGITNPGLYTITSISNPSIGVVRYFTTDSGFDVGTLVNITGATPSGYNGVYTITDANPGTSFDVSNSTTGSATGTITYTRSTPGGDNQVGSGLGRGGFTTGPNSGGYSGNNGNWGSGGGGGSNSNSFVTFAGSGGGGIVLIRYRRDLVGG